MGGTERAVTGVWSRIQGIEKDLMDMGISLQRLLHQKEDGNGWEWDLESEKKFSVRSLRKLIDAINLPISDQETEWCTWLPSKVNIHMWRVFLNKLATRDNLSKRGVSLSSEECPMCLSTTETLDHMFLACSTTKNVSAHLGDWANRWPTILLPDQRSWVRPTTVAGDVIGNKVRKVISAAF